MQCLFKSDDCNKIRAERDALVEALRKASRIIRNMSALMKLDSDECDILLAQYEDGGENGGREPASAEFRS